MHERRTSERLQLYQLLAGRLRFADGGLAARWLWGTILQERYRITEYN